MKDMEWYEQQTEKSLLFLIYREVRFLATVVKVWIALLLLALVAGPLLWFFVLAARLAR